MEFISGSGTFVTIYAPLVPQGYEITQLAHDVDVIDADDVDIRDWGMGVNGDLVAYDTPNPIIVALGLIPNTADDKFMQRLVQIDRFEKNKLQVRQNITMNINYRDGDPVILPIGTILRAPLIDSINSTKYKRSKSYVFVFEGRAN